MVGYRFTIPYTVRVADVNYGGHVANSAVLNFAIYPLRAPSRIESARVCPNRAVAAPCFFFRNLIVPQACIHK
jgi:hypothetical protein